MRNLTLIIFAVALLVSCGKSIKPEAYFSKSELDTLLVDIAPYVNKNQKKFSFEEKFSAKSRPYYAALAKSQSAAIKYVFPTDSVYYFLTVQKDLTSLFEHYKAIGGYFKMDEHGQKDFNFLFYSPRFTKEEIDTKATELFQEMTESGSLNKYLGNRDYIQWPNEDVFYDAALRTWTLSESSEWAKIKEIAQGDDIGGK
jgi:hypothetical protein